MLTVMAVKLFLDAKANMEVKEDAGSTPLHWATRNGHFEAVKLLLDAKASVEAKDNDGWTPPHRAA